MVCGLPDSGLVAKIAVDHLIDVLRPELIAKVYSVYLPPQVIIRNNGLVELMSHQLYYSKSAQLLIYTGDSQPIESKGAFLLSRVVVELAKSHSVSELIILAAMIKGSPVIQPNVYVSATSDKLAEEYIALGAKKTGTGAITWMHGLILGEAYRSNLRAVCLSGETQGELPDPKAAEAALSILGKRLDIPIDLTNLKEKVRDFERLFTPERQAEWQQKERREPSYIG